MIKIISIAKSNSSRKTESTLNQVDISASLPMYLVIILLFLSLDALLLAPLFNLVMKTYVNQPSSSIVNCQGENLLAISSWLLSGVALFVTILLVIKEIHSSKVSTLKNTVENKEKMIVKLGRSWCALYEAAQNAVIDKNILNDERKKIEEEMGDIAKLFPSIVKRIISTNEKK